MTVHHTFNSELYSAPVMRNLQNGRLEEKTGLRLKIGGIAFTFLKVGDLI